MMMMITSTMKHFKWQNSTSAVRVAAMKRKQSYKMHSRLTLVAPSRARTSRQYKNQTNNDPQLSSQNCHDSLLPHRVISFRLTGRQRSTDMPPFLFLAVPPAPGGMASRCEAPLRRKICAHLLAMPPSMRELATRTHNDTDTQAQSNTEAINEVNHTQKTQWRS